MGSVLFIIFFLAGKCNAKQGHALYNECIEVEAKILFRSFILMLGFFTRIPVPQIEYTEERYVKGIPLLPFVGAVSGGLLWCVFQLSRWLPMPVVALLLGVFLAMTLIPASEKKNTLKWVTQGVTDSAAILAITGAGGSFGAILKLLPIADSVGGLVSSGLGVLIPFIIAMILKLAMGASTVAMITTASMMAPLMESMGYTSPLARVLVVLAIGAGSMVASHANDSYFWVVSQFSDMKTEEAYRCQTGMTAVMGITVIIVLFVISLFI